MKSKYVKGVGIEQKLASANKIVSAVGLFMLVVAVGVFVVYNPAFERHNIFVILTFFVNIALFVTQLLIATTEHSFGFKVMFWIFNLFFLGLAPFYQYVSGSYIWGYRATDRQYLTSNIYVLAWSIIYIVGYTVRFGKKRVASLKLKKQVKIQEYDYIIRKNALNFMLALSIIIVAYYAAFVGLGNMFIRYSSSNKAISGSTPLKLLEEHVLTNTVLYTFVMHLIEAKQKKIVTFQMIVATACLLICCFPTSLSRYAMAAVYAGIMIILIDKTRKGRWFITVFILGLVVIFPAIDIFRSVYSLEQASDFWRVVEEKIQQVYTSGDYDAYSMFINVRRYVGFFDFSYGKQLLGALLFFFPRSIWSSKPIGTGHTVFTALHPEFTNVSAPLLAEGFMDFGVFGVAIYAIVAGAITSWADRKYWASDNPLSKERIVYPFLIIQFFFLLRGDMMSGGAYLIARMVMGLAIYHFVVKKVPVSEKNELPEKPRLSKYIKQK